MKWFLTLPFLADLFRIVNKIRLPLFGGGISGKIEARLFTFCNLFSVAKPPDAIRELSPKSSTHARHALCLLQSHYRVDVTQARPNRIQDP